MTIDLIEISPGGIDRHNGGFVVPAIVADADDQAARRFVEFFTANTHQA